MLAADPERALDSFVACRSRNGFRPPSDASTSATAGCRRRCSSTTIERRSRACAPRLSAPMARASGGERMCGSRGATGGSRCASTSRWATRGCASPGSSSRGCGRRSSGSSPRRWSAACWRGRRCPATAPTSAATSRSSCSELGSTIRAWRRRDRAARRGALVALVSARSSRSTGRPAAVARRASGLPRPRFRGSTCSWPTIGTRRPRRSASRAGPS